MNREPAQPNIDRAIRRSRSARAALRQRRRRRLALAAAALGLCAAVPLSFSVAGLAGNDVVHATVRGAQNLAELLGQRSPGERTEAVLTKHRPAQRALAKARPKPGAVEPPVAPNIMPPAAAEVLIPQPTLVSAASDLPIAFASFTPPPSLGTIIAPPGGGGGVVTPGTPGTPDTPGGPQTEPTPIPREPVPAVPEPSTWAMMLLGFGAIGWSVRRRQPATRSTARAA